MGHAASHPRSRPRLKDANGNTTTYGYDGFDRLNDTQFPDATHEHLVLDENGNVTARTNRAGATLSYTLDDLDEMRTKTMPQPPSADLVTTWTYLLDGRLDTLSDTTSALLDYGYDTAGRMTSVVNHIAGFGGNRTVSYTLDKSGNRIKLTWPTQDVNNYAVNYCYDSLNRMTGAAEIKFEIEFDSIH
ncbi:MAG: hypothetical protein JOZ72_06390 [Alphaproteobacteria bacterium]|nr:hypothetical protein [Alphaproteobacteria bacterium]